MGFFSKIKEGLKKTRDSIAGKVDVMLGSFTKIDEDLFEELEEILILSDVGVNTAQTICEKLRERVKVKRITDPRLVKQQLKEIVSELLEGENEITIDTVPTVILVVGVNGVGKTTTIGKLAHNFKEEGHSVLLGAADTFRAAAIDQLDVWAKRAGVEMVRHAEGADPAAVVFDTISAAKARGMEVVICDTAGRLHNKKNLMDELSKMTRIIHREALDSHVEVLLVLDATTGQNGLNQAKLFKEATGLITGIVLTKLDGTAKGGVVLAIKEELGIPVKYIGVGEQIDDMQPFVPSEFAAALFDGEEQ